MDPRPFKFRALFWDAAYSDIFEKLLPRLLLRCYYSNRRTASLLPPGGVRRYYTHAGLSHAIPQNRTPVMIHLLKLVRGIESTLVICVVPKQHWLKYAHRLCAPLWVKFKKASLQKLQVAYNDCLRILLRKPRWCSATASEMFCNARVNTFLALLRNLMYKCICRLNVSHNFVIMLLSNPCLSNINSFHSYIMLIINQL